MDGGVWGLILRSWLAGSLECKLLDIRCLSVCILVESLLLGVPEASHGLGFEAWMLIEGRNCLYPR